MSGVLAAIDSFILYLATERGLSTNYQLLVRRVLEGLASWLKEHREVSMVADVTTDLLTDYLARRKKDGLAASSARIELVAMKIFFRWGIRRKPSCRQEWRSISPAR
jgi:integrase/recombinase XerD